MIPDFAGHIEFDAKLGEAGPRVLNAAGKDSLRQVLRTHHRQRIPGHFQASARSKYQHKERTPAYKAIKMRRYKSRTDEVKTGRTRDRMVSQYQISVSGTVTGTSANAPGLTGTLRMSFPFPASFDNSTNKVTLQQMAEEISRWTSEEEKAAAQQFADLYTQQINAATAGKARK